jgi:prolyl oligopeptidase
MSFATKKMTPPAPRRGAIATVLLTAIAQPAAAQPLAPPSTPVHEVVETHFGISVVDPYRWIEDTTSAATTAWLKAQDAYARAILAHIPNRSALRRRIAELDEDSVSVTNVERIGHRYFYLKSAAGSAHRDLYVREGLGGAERRLVDVAARSTPERHVAIDFFAASDDGRKVAYALSSGGSEESTIEVIDVSSGEVAPDRIACGFASDATWLPDGSLLYSRILPPPPGGVAADKLKRSRVYRHVLGTSQEGDVAVFGYGVSLAIPIGENDYSGVEYLAASHTLMVTVRHGVSRERAAFTVPLRALDGAKTPWRQVVRREDDVVAIAQHGDALFLLSRHRAPRYAVLETSLSRPDIAHAKVVIGESEAVAVSLAAMGDALYVRLVDGGPSRIVRVPYGRGRPTQLQLPFAANVRIAGAADRLDKPGATSSEDPGFVAELSSWTESPRWFEYTPGKPFVDTGLLPRASADWSGIAVDEVTVRARDGALVPLSILSPKGLERNGSHPTIVYGYGAYGTSLLPSHRPAWLAWLERGGVFAVVHARGGGERGEEWHLGGMQASKHNSVEDFIAAGEYVVEQGYTSAAHLAGWSGSAGGVVVGGALTRRPDLFRAMISQVGVSDPLRAEHMPAGPANVPEYGSTATIEGYLGLLAMDPYLRVQPKTSYPAVLFTGGMNDPRVAVWQPAKLAARLQACSNSGNPVLLRLEADGGHGNGSTRAQRADETADELAFLFWQLGGAELKASR